MPSFPCPVFNQELPIPQSSLHWQCSLFRLDPSTIYKPQLLPKYKHSPGLYHACYFSTAFAPDARGFCASQVIQHFYCHQEDKEGALLYNMKRVAEAASQTKCIACICLQQ